MDSNPAGIDLLTNSKIVLLFLAFVRVCDCYLYVFLGIADIVMRNEHIRYVSIHQTPAFPYMGETNQIMGPNQNVFTLPMKLGTTFASNSGGYNELYRQALNFISEPAVWEPHLIIICAGYDALDSDELANVNLRSNDYFTMTQMLYKHLESNQGPTSESSTIPPILFGLEGGYQLSPIANGGNLPDAVLKTIEGILSSYGSSNANDNNNK